MGKKGESMKELMLEANIDRTIVELIKVQKEKDMTIVRIKELNAEIERLRELLSV